MNVLQNSYTNPEHVPISNALQHGNIIYTVQIPRDPVTRQASGDGDIKEQARRVFEQLKCVLESAGSSLAQTLQITIYLIDGADAPGMNEVYKQYFTQAPYPNRATVVVRELLVDNCRIEIVVQAAGFAQAC